MSDEAYFHLSEYINKQNFHQPWPQPTLMKCLEPLHNAQVTMLCNSALSIIGPYFFEDANVNCINVISEQYV